ncbi:MAG: multicopper oxidase domain-containing protein, partial [Anaerolineales bacterium]
MPLKRRDFLKIGVAGALSTATAATLAAAQATPDGRVRIGRVSHGLLDHQPVGTGSLYSSPTPTGVDPIAFLTTFDGGTPGLDEQGRTVREYRVFAADAQIEVAPGVYFPAWAYNGQVPGPTLRCTEGDLVRVHFANHQTHPHTIHFHGFHAANMDGVFEQVGPGQGFTYEFRGEPFGLHLYHCHTMPLKKHIAKGLYGAFIVDPAEPR